MNTTRAPAFGDDDIRAFTRAEPAAPAPRRRRRWPWVLLGAATLGLLMLLMLGSLVWSEIQTPHGLAGTGDWHIGIDDEGWQGGAGVAGVLTALSLALVAVLAVVVLVPLVLLGVGLAIGLAFTLAALSVTAALMLALGVVALVLVVLSAPLWLFVLLLWWALKPRAAVASNPTR